MFTGYSDKVGDFFWELRFNNLREWFNPRKAEFDQLVMQPTKALANELYDWFQEPVSGAGAESAYLAHLPRRTAAVRARAAEGRDLVLIPERDRATATARRTSGSRSGPRATAWASATGCARRTRRECASSSIRTPSRWKSWRGSLPDRTCSRSPARNTRSRRGMRTTSSAVVQQALDRLPLHPAIRCCFRLAGAADVRRGRLPLYDPILSVF